MCTEIRKINLSTPNGIEEVTVKYTNKYTEEYDSLVSVATEIDGKWICAVGNQTEETLIMLAKSLPEGYEIISCLTCRHGNFCPVGDGDNEIFCITDFEPKQKSDLFFVTEDLKERKKRIRSLFDYCKEYKAQSDDYYTYNDYLYQMQCR